jgi:hypothetical protein
MTLVNNSLPEERIRNNNRKILLIGDTIRGFNDLPSYLILITILQKERTWQPANRNDVARYFRA